MIKKVIFISLWDVICIPSKSKMPKDITDYQLNYHFIMALKSMKDAVRVNLLACFDNIDFDEASFSRMLSVISYAISVHTAKAVLPYYSFGSELRKPLKDAIRDTSRISIFNDKKDWLIIGDGNLASNAEIDLIGIKEFCYGGFEVHTEGTEE